MRQVQEEGPRLVGPYELHCLPGVLLGDRGVLLDARGEDLEIPHQRQRDVLAIHVVAVRDSEVVVESLVGRHEVGMVAQVPLADGHRGIAAGLEDLGDGHLRRVQPLAGCGEQHAEVLFVDMHVDTSRVAAGHQAGSRRGADRAGRIEVGQPHALAGHPVQYRRVVRLGPEGADVGIAEVIAENDDEIRLGVGQGRVDGQQGEHQGERVTHGTGPRSGVTW